MQSRAAIAQFDACTIQTIRASYRDMSSPRYEVLSVKRFTERECDMRLQSPIMETVIGPLDGSPKRSGSNRLTRVDEADMTALASGVDWADVLKTVGSTTAIAAVLGFLGQVAIKHLLHRDIDTHKSNLKRESDLALAEAKAQVERELSTNRARADAALLVQKAIFDKQLETFSTDFASRAVKAHRIREDLERWANPILRAVMELQRRLDNILKNEGYLALSPDAKNRVNSEWSVTHEYFLSSTIFLFSQYFCWVRLLEERLSFELFERHSDKDDLLKKIRDVRRTLSEFPLAELRGLSGAGDRQIFCLQQRGMGEMLALSDGVNLRCMRFSEFLQNWSEPEFRHRFEPLTRLLDGIGPTNAHRWKRLELMGIALERLHGECRRLLR
jgi:hypothetical protein